jgi:hypothetical protein
LKWQCLAGACSLTLGAAPCSAVCRPWLAIAVVTVAKPSRPAFSSASTLGSVVSFAAIS